MTAKRTRFPHTISYRLTDEDYLKIGRAVGRTTLTPHDWCRAAALEKINQDQGLTRTERLLFEQFVCAEYLVARGFQLLAEKKLLPEEWKKFRALARENASEIADRVLAIHAIKDRHKE